MSTLDEVRARHSAELQMLELDDELVRAKEGDGVTPELKAQVREARRVFRELRDADTGYPEDDDEADAAARPATVESRAADGRDG